METHRQTARVWITKKCSCLSEALVVIKNINNVKYFLFQPISHFPFLIPSLLLCSSSSLHYASHLILKYAVETLLLSHGLLLCFRGHLKQEEGLWPLTSTIHHFSHIHVNKKWSFHPGCLSLFLFLLFLMLVIITQSTHPHPHTLPLWFTLLKQKISCVWHHWLVIISLMGWCNFIVVTHTNF